MRAKLIGAKAVAAAIGMSAVVFNRGNAEIASVAVLIFAVMVLAIEALIQRERFFLVGLNLVGLVLVLTFASVMLRMPIALDRFYILVLLVSFTQLLSETAINFTNGWFKRSNIDHAINWVAHLAIWSIFIWASPDAIGAIGIFGAYSAILAVHWGIEAAGPKAKEA